MIINKPEKGKKQKEFISYVSDDKSITDKSVCSFFNKHLKVDVGTDGY